MKGAKVLQKIKATTIRVWRRLGLNKTTPGAKLYTLMSYIVLISLVFVFLYPFLYMLVTSFKSYNDLANVMVKWYPKEFTLKNWAVAFESLNFFRSFGNSVLVTLCATLGHLLSCSLIGYGFARFRFPLKKVLFVLVLLTIIVPIQSIIVPQYMLYARMGWVGTYFPMIVPSFFGFGLKGGLYVFLFYQSFSKLPASLEEAAYIDGCNPYRTFFNIILPSSGAVLLVSTILSIVWNWNDYFEPSLYINAAENYLLPQQLPALEAFIQSLQTQATEAAIAQRQEYTTGVLMAATALSILPLLIMYAFLQNRFVQSIDRTGLVE